MVGAAGFDRLDPQLIRQYVDHYAQDELRISLGDLLKIGRQSPSDNAESFNTAYLVLRGSCRVNAHYTNTTVPLDAGQILWQR
jgi:starch phosphorylase